MLVIDDLHWAEPPMLDLVEHVADWSRSAPIFLLCIARPELLDVRPGWAGGKLNATSVLLEPLPARGGGARERPSRGRRPRRGDAGADSLDGGGEPTLPRGDGAARTRRRGSVDVPPTIQALMQARLDTLERGRAHRDRPRRGRRASVSPRRGHGARARDAGVDVTGRSAVARAQGARPSRSDADPGRRGLPLQAPPDPRHRLRVAPEGRPGGAARALRRLARKRTPASRAGRDRRLPPRAGRALSSGARRRRPRAAELGHGPRSGSAPRVWPPSIEPTFTRRGTFSHVRSHSWTRGRCGGI